MSYLDQIIALYGEIQEVPSTVPRWEQLEKHLADLLKPFGDDVEEAAYAFWCALQED